MPDKTIREILFKDWDGCSNHDCIVKNRTGMGTNGSCGCLVNMSRSELHILNARLATIIDVQIKENGYAQALDETGKDT